MTKKQKLAYSDTEALREALKSLIGGKYQLDCNCHTTIGHQFSNSLVIRGNGKNQPLTLICASCAY